MKPHADPDVQRLQASQDISMCHAGTVDLKAVNTDMERDSRLRKRNYQKRIAETISGQDIGDRGARPREVMRSRAGAIVARAPKKEMIRGFRKAIEADRSPQVRRRQSVPLVSPARWKRRRGFLSALFLYAFLVLYDFLCLFTVTFFFVLGLFFVFFFLFFFFFCVLFLLFFFCLAAFRSNYFSKLSIGGSFAEKRTPWDCQ